jgi:hypothetical protein
MAAMTNNSDALKALEPLLGKWRLMAVFKDIPPAGRLTFIQRPPQPRRTYRRFRRRTSTQAGSTSSATT